MSEQNNGGPAFPLAFKWDDEKLNGATLRDYFAAKAMQAFIGGAATGTSFGANYPETNEAYSIAAYAMADAMLKARG